MKKKNPSSIIKQLQKYAGRVGDPALEEKILKKLTELNDSLTGVYEQATRDNKTGLYNMYYFEDSFEREFDKAQRDEQDLSLYMMDIDFLKKLNDTYGHSIVDDLLARFGEIVQDRLRKFDIPARYGGDEFIIIFPQSSINQSKRIVSRLEEAIREDPFLSKYNLTTSGGLTQYKKGDTIEVQEGTIHSSLIERADQALYQAKEEGRDRFIILK